MAQKYFKDLDTSDKWCKTNLNVWRKRIILNPLVIEK